LLTHLAIQDLHQFLAPLKQPLYLLQFFILVNKPRTI